MDTQLILAAFWFLFGIISYRIVSYMMGYGRSVLIIQQTVVGMLLMLKYYDKVFQAEKEKILEKTLATLGVDKDKLKADLEAVRKQGGLTLNI